MPGDPVSRRAGARPVRVGFFGKLPSRGDFVRRGLSRAVVGAWDGWVQSVMPAQRSDSFNGQWWAMCAWRFAFDPGICGPCPTFGVLLPSADSVGRLFPLLIAAEAAGPCKLFLDAAEAAGVEAVRTVMEPEALATRLNQISCLPGRLAATSPPVARWWQQGRPGGTQQVQEPALPDAAMFMQMVAS